ncbi:MAG: MotA/TolQ/ExbB proton channel family protein [Verrucomicrobia bacterium]|nr:MotA/TolQ/ExbB proton channel family protein [Verrucomicrobiota bacterium]
MKKNPLFILLSSLILSSGFCVESEIIDLEKELLSLEHEFLDSLEENTVPSKETEELSLEDPSISIILETAETRPFITEQVIVEATEPETFLTPIPSYPHEEQRQITGQAIQISFGQVFSNSPFIYSLLLGMSFTSIVVCLYIILRIRQQASTCEQFSKEVRNKFLNQDFEQAADLCSTNQNWLSKIVKSGIDCKKYGLNIVLENMKSEGKRATISSWQQLGILQDIAIISPMLGLLGTVIGLFYAFYDLNRSSDSISTLLDGLGISVGTTVAGICVAILSMILHSMTKFRLVRSLAKIETEANSLAYLIDQDSNHKE